MKDMEEGKEEQNLGAGNTLSAASAASEPTHEMTQSGATPTQTDGPNFTRSVFACDHAHITSTTDDNIHRGGRSDQAYEEFLALLASPSNHEDMSSATSSPSSLTASSSSSSSSMDMISIAEAQEPRTVSFTSENTNADATHHDAAGCQGKSTV